MTLDPSTLAARGGTHPIDAPTDPDTQDVEAVDDVDQWLPRARTGLATLDEDTTTGVDAWLEDVETGSSTAQVDGLPDPGDWTPEERVEDAPTDHVVDVDTLPVRPGGGSKERESTGPVVVPRKREG